MSSSSPSEEEEEEEESLEEEEGRPVSREGSTESATAARSGLLSCSQNRHNLFIRGGGGTLPSVEKDSQEKDFHKKGK